MTITTNHTTFKVVVPATKAHKGKTMIVNAPSKIDANILAVKAMRKELSMPGFTAFCKVTPHTFKPGDKFAPVVGA